MKSLRYIAALVAILAATPAHAANMLCPSALITYVDTAGAAHTTNAQAITTGVTGSAITDLTKLGCQQTNGAITSTAATDPAVSNDGTQGFSIGSLWLDKTGPKLYAATDVSTGAAVWTQIGAVTNLNPTFTTALLGNPVVMTASGSVSVANLNTGSIIIAGVAAHKIYVTGYSLLAVGGTAGTCTGVLLEDDNGTPVVVSTVAAAALTTSNVNVPSLANNVLGVGFGPNGLTTAANLQLIKNGSDCATMTSLKYTVNYVVQ